MKKLLIPFICASTLLGTASVYAGSGLLRTADVLCKPTAHNTTIRNENGGLLFDARGLSRVINANGGIGACQTGVDSKTGMYKFSAIDGGKKEDVANPARGGDIEVKQVFRVQLSVVGYAYSNGSEVLTGKVEPEQIAQPNDYQAIVKRGVRVISPDPIPVPEVKKEDTYRHILR